MVQILNAHIALHDEHRDRVHRYLADQGTCAQHVEAKPPIHTPLLALELLCSLLLDLLLKIPQSFWLKHTVKDGVSRSLHLIYVS